MLSLWLCRLRDKKVGDSKKYQNRQNMTDEKKYRDRYISRENTNIVVTPNGRRYKYLLIMTRAEFSM